MNNIKLVYLVPENLSIHLGLKYKVERQAFYWRNAGFDVYLVYLALGYAERVGGEIVREEKVPNYGSFGMLSKFAKLSWDYRFAQRVLRDIKPDITYARYLFPAFNISRISRNAGALICEVNSDDREEFSSNGRISGSYNKLLRNIFLSQVHGFVFMTDELRASRSFVSLNVPTCTIPNGADVSDFPFLENTANAEPNLVFVGSPRQSWHGLDKIYGLVRRLGYCRFHIVGPCRQECEAVWSDLPDNVEFHGYLPADRVAEVVSKADVGIGTLALHRKGMSEACPLKVRQYLAQGVPVIAGYRDPDIQQPVDFYLEIPNCDRNVEDTIDELVSFVDRVYRDSEIRLEARKFAEERLSFSLKEERRLEFFKQVLIS